MVLEAQVDTEFPYRVPIIDGQGAPKGRQQKGETGPGTHIFADFCRFSLIFGSLCKARDLGVADLRRKPRIFAGNRRFLQKPVSPICCLPFGVLLDGGTIAVPLFADPVSDS